MDKPWYRNSDTWLGIAMWVFIVSVASAPFLPALGGWFATVPITCSDERIPFKTTTIEDPSFTQEYSFTDPEGTNGVKRQCTGRDGSDQGTTIKIPAIDAVYHKGTKVPEQSTIYTEPLYNESGGGAVCNDGSRSYSTGRGTCSWHGGVAYWL